MIAIQNKWRIPTDLKGSKGQVTTGTQVVLTDLEDGTPCGATVRCTVLPLMDLAARVVGQTYTCRGLEESRFTLDTLLLTKIGYYAFPQDFVHPLTLAYLGFKEYNNTCTTWRVAIRLIDDDQVSDVRQIGFMLIGHVAEVKRFNSMQADVTITFEQQHITSCKCSACSGSGVVVCSHALALMIYRIQFPDKVPIHAPLTETLSVLNRNQMLRLIHMLMNDPSDVTMIRIMKYKGRMESLSSVMNEVHGAPDATFMINSKGRPLWARSLEKLSDNLKDEFTNSAPYSDLNKQCRGLKDTNGFEDVKQSRGNSDNEYVKRRPFPNFGFFNVHIPQSGNRVWNKYMSKVLELLSIRKVESAVQILVTIMESVTSVILLKKSAKNYLTPASRFMYDIERQLCFFVVCYKGRWRDEVLTAAARVNSLLSQCPWYMDRHEKGPSEFYDIRTMKLSTKTLKSMGVQGELDNLISKFNTDGPMYQVLITYYLPEKLLSDLMENLSSCDWPFEVFLFVFDLLVQWKWVYKEKRDGDYKYIVKSLGSRILQMTLLYSDQFSIMSCDRDFQKSKIVQDHVDIDSWDVAKKSDVLPGAQQLKRGLDDNLESSSPRKKMKFNKGEINLSPGQVYCTLLFASQMIITSSEYSVTEFTQSPDVVKAFIRSVEMERFAVRAGTDLHQHCKLRLNGISTSIITRLKLSSNKDGLNALQAHATLYGKMILKYGLEFWTAKDGNIPLRLVDIIIGEGTMDMEERFELSFRVLTHFIAPVQDTEISDHCPSDIDHYGFSSKPIALTTFRTLLEILLSYDSSENSMPNILQAMEHVGKVKDLYFLQMAFEVFSNMMERFSVAQNERFVDLIMAFLRQYFPISYKRLHNARDRMFKDLCSLCEKTMEYTMRSILRTLEEVCHIFIENQLKGFVRLLENCTSDSKTLMKKVTKELAFYLRRNATFDVTFVDFIFILKKYHTGRHACIDVILEQHEKFSTESLLYLAKREHEIEPMRVTRRQNILSERIFELIRAGMSNLTKNVGKSRMLHDLYFETKFLVFFMDVFARNTEVALTQEEQFTSFLRLLIEKCELDTIVKVFTAQKYSMEMTETIRNKIGEKLSIRISKIFLKCLTICNHIYYSEIVIKILNAKDLFEMFVPNGTERFNDMVNVLKEKLKSKKKLQRILTITFD